MYYNQDKASVPSQLLITTNYRRFLTMWNELACNTESPCLSSSHQKAWFCTQYNLLPFDQSCRDRTKVRWTLCSLSVPCSWLTGVELDLVVHCCCPFALCCALWDAFCSTELQRSVKLLQPSCQYWSVSQYYSPLNSLFITVVSVNRTDAYYFVQTLETLSGEIPEISSFWDKSWDIFPILRFRVNINWTFWCHINWLIG